MRSRGLGEATGQARWLDEAVAVADTMLEWFWDPVNGGLYTTAEDAEALDRPAEGPGRQRDTVGELDGGDGALPPRRAHR